MMSSHLNLQKSRKLVTRTDPVIQTVDSKNPDLQVFFCSMIGLGDLGNMGISSIVYGYI